MPHNTEYISSKITKSLIGMFQLQLVEHTCLAMGQAEDLEHQTQEHGESRFAQLMRVRGIGSLASADIKGLSIRATLYSAAPS